MAVSSTWLQIWQSRGAALTPPFPEPRAPSWVDGVAVFVSAVASPPVLAAAMITIATAVSNPAGAWPWVALSITLSVLAPVGYLLWLLRRGVVSDLGVQRREERLRPLAFTLAGLASAAAVLWLGTAPALLAGLAAAQQVQTTAMLAITVGWKISMHGAAIGAFVALLFFIGGPQAAPALLAVPAVAWSRIRLRCHTPAQTDAGAAPGALATLGKLVLSPV